MAVGAARCAAAPEQAVLGQFFAAARLRDTTALAGLATATFEPHIDGIVTSFSITGATPERRAPLASALVDLSIDGPLDKIGIAQADGEAVSKDVTLDAQLRRFDGQMVRKTLVVTMQRAVLKGDPEILGRWIVTGIRQD